MKICQCCAALVIDASQSCGTCGEASWAPAKMRPVGTPVAVTPSADPPAEPTLDMSEPDAPPVGQASLPIAEPPHDKRRGPRGPRPN